MINKFYKTIHNKYSRFFRFIFFLRYLFALFLTSFILIFFIPKFFDYEKRAKVFKNHLIKNYELDISKYEKIQFIPFPRPKIELKNAIANLGSSPIKLNIKKLEIYPHLLNIYNFENFKSYKIVLSESNTKIETLDLEFFIKKLISQKNELYLNDLNLKIENENQTLVSLEKIKFANYGYKKNIVEGNIFGKKFKVNIDDKLNYIKAELVNTGINLEINLNEKKNKNSVNGVIKSKILNTNLKFNFDYDQASLKIHNSFFRSKNLSFNNNSEIIFNPFLDINSKFEIEDINENFFHKLQVDKLLMYKNILKQLNTKNEINFNSKKFNRNLIDKLNIKFDLAYGRLNFLKNFFISDNFFQCEGSINLLEEYPILFFDCSVKSDNKKNLLKKFNINFKKDNETLNISAKGNLSIINNKINFKNILVNQNYKASNEDLKFFKETFESILFDENLIEIFNLNKIKRFILEVS